MNLLPYRTDFGLSDSLRELDTWRARFDLKGPLPRAWAGRLRSDLEAESTAASVSMEGVPVTLEEVHRILAGDAPREVSREDRELVAGYRDAMTYVLRRADDPGFRWQPELLVALHDRVLGGRYDLGAGRFRAGPVQLVHEKTRRIVFEPPAAEKVADLVSRICERAERHPGHPALLAGGLHVAIAAIHPFRDGNGRVARVVASLAMYRGGFKRQEFTSLEEWWGRHLDAYYRLFECLGERFSKQRNVTPFIRGHLEAQLAQVRALDLRERVERQLWQALENALVDIGQSPRLANALWDAFVGREVTAGYYRSIADVSSATATNDLGAAVAAGLLASRGQRRGRRYTAGQHLAVVIAKEIGVEVSGAADQQRSAIIATLTKRMENADRLRRG